MQPAPRTLFEKIWERHKVVERDGQTLLYIDRHFIHDGSHRAFEMQMEFDFRDREQRVSHERRPRTSHASRCSTTSVAPNTSCARRSK